jgi:hypothetical protein
VESKEGEGSRFTFVIPRRLNNKAGAIPDLFKVD